jgi:hypothetical protein
LSERLGTDLSHAITKVGGRNRIDAIRIARDAGRI